MSWLNMGEILKVNAIKFPHKMAVKSAERELSFKEYNERACRLANAWLEMGLKKGDRIAALFYNVIEYMEIYAAAAKAGVVTVPVNFRWMGPEIECVPRSFSRRWSRSRRVSSRWGRTSSSS